jgi:DNA-binding XRE family transcriptional regulator
VPREKVRHLQVLIIFCRITESFEQTGDKEMTTGDRLKSLRKNHGLGKAEFANMFKVQAQTVAYWEKDTFVPRLDKLMKISKHFDVSIDWLLYGSNKPDSDV